MTRRFRMGREINDCFYQAEKYFSLAIQKIKGLFLGYIGIRYEIRLNKLKCYELINCTNTNAPLSTPV